MLKNSFFMENKPLKVSELLFSNLKLITMGLIGMVIGTTISLLFPIVMRYMIDVAITGGDWPTLFLTIMGLVVLPVLSTLFNSITIRVNIKIGGDITDHLSQKVFAKITTYSPKTLNQFKPGELVERLYSFLW